VRWPITRTSVSRRVTLDSISSHPTSGTVALESRASHKLVCTQSTLAPSSEEAFMQNGWPYVLVNQMRGS
jgi:hypothetical protein